MKSYETLSEAVNDLLQQGYTYNFSLRTDAIECAEINHSLKADEFEIDAVYRFEGMTDPGDENILYAISSTDGKMKGLLVNAFGVYSDDIAAELVAKLHGH